MRIDAEVRFWRRSNTPTRFQNAPLLTQDYLPQHLAPHLMEHGFTGCVAILETELAAVSSMERDTLMASHALVAYAIGLAGYANIKVLVPAFYALGDARTPALISCFSILVNAALGWTAIHVFGFGHVALALATSVVAVTNFAILYMILNRRIGALEGLGSSLLPILGGTMVVLAIASLVRFGAGVWLPNGTFVTRLVVVALAVPASAVGFALVSAALGLVESREMIDWLRARLGLAAGRP